MNIFRHILIFLSVLMFSPSLFGQSLELVEGSGFAEGTVEDVNPLAAYATFKNVTEQPIWFKIFMLTEGITEGHTAALCWQVCYEYTDLNFESPEAYPLDAFESSFHGDFSAYLLPYKFLGMDENFEPQYSDPVPGESLIRFEFVNTEDPGDVLVYEVLFRVLNPGNVEDAAIEIVKIAPNPASYFVGVTLDEVQAQTASKIEIYDSIGNLVSSVNMMGIGNYANINVSSLSQGIYHLNLVNTDGSRSKFRTIAIQR
ncbi:MAG: T9SS type A sorting domain-containing protein [Candidatus Kapabacteria bacterium]|nr:T9SS type A sorting domain-containing protein [Candidatus Kapabacteria bacterium]